MPQIRNYDLPTDSLTRVKSRDASASKKHNVQIIVDASQSSRKGLGRIWKIFMEKGLVKGTIY